MDLFGDQVRKPHSTVVECNFDDYFDQQVKELEGSAEPSQRTPQIVRNDPDPTTSPHNESEEPPPAVPGLLSGRKSPSSAAPSTDATPTSTPDTSRPSTPSNGHLLSAKVGRGGTSRRARKAASGKPAGIDGLKDRNSTGKAKGKSMRRWDADGLADEDGDTPLDYSATNDADSRPVSSAGVESIDMAASGTRTSQGQYILKDLDDEVHSILQNANQKKSQSIPSDTGMLGSSLGAITGLFRNVIGGKTLTKADLEKPMKGMEELLLNKNVAREAAVRLCESVERELIGQKTGSFESTSPFPPFSLPTHS